MEQGTPNGEETLTSFIAEDTGYGDITTNSLIDSNLLAQASIICKERAILAGIEEAVTFLKLVGCQGTVQVNDGERVPPGTTVLIATGPARELLRIERTLLNLLSHMSGVATATAELVSIANKESGGKVRISCTRKTLPGLRYFEKKAVAIAGGDTHRLRLDDEVLIKDNHLALTGSIAECVRKARSNVSFTKKIEVEATTPSQAVEASQAGADIVLLDNMTPTQVKESLNALESKGLRDRIVVEASGGITKDNIATYAKSGVDVISIGALTHSAKAIDMGMEIYLPQRNGASEHFLGPLHDKQAR